MKPKGDLKNYCWDDKSCEVVVTGWLSTYYVCRTCKIEVTEKMYQDYLDRKKRQKKKEDDLKEL